MYRTLKYIRRFLAVAVGGIILLYFIDFTQWLPDRLHSLLHLQIVPALMSGMVGILVLHLVLALLVGRIYCSVLCPLGILQDFIYRIKIWYKRIAKKQKDLRLKYTKPLDILRYSVLGATAISFLIFGGGLLVLWLDPYSNFGRLVTALVKPVAVWGNNIIASVANDMGNYSFYNVSLYTFSWTLLISSSILLIVLIVMVWRRQRLWCNTICPAGALLSLLSKYSLIRVSIDDSKCVHCRKCTQTCKSRCIEDKQYHVDTSRCVSCYNCLTVCKYDAIGLAVDGWKRKSKGVVPKKQVEAATDRQADTPQGPGQEFIQAPAQGANVSRNLFLKGSAAALAAIPMAAWALPTGLQKRTLNARPPGAVDNFGEKCTACQLCANRCPMQVIKPAFMENGFTGMMQPYLYFQPHCYCNYECTICSDVCPNGALEHMTVEQKKIRQIGIVNFVVDECIVKSENQDCGACAEHCPTGAVEMVPYQNGLTIPEIEPNICIGCGACESICPVRPRAIFIEGLRPQGVADAPHIQEATETVIDDFGF